MPFDEAAVERIKAAGRSKLAKESEALKAGAHAEHEAPTDLTQRQGARLAGPR